MHLRCGAGARRTTRAIGARRRHGAGRRSVTQGAARVQGGRAHSLRPVPRATRLRAVPALPPPSIDSALRIRRGVEADLAGLVALENGAFASDRLSGRQLRRHLESASAQLLVARRGGEVVGSALLFFRRGSDIARLYSIAVAAGERGRGLGSALLAASERTARQRGARRLRLEVRERNAPARRLYDHAGFRVFGARPGYYEDGANAVRYEKRLEARGGER